MLRVPNREVYPNAPLVLVAVEIRHPDSGLLTEQQTQLIKGRLAEDVQLSRPCQRPPGVIATLTGLGARHVAQTAGGVSPRLMSRDQSTSVTFHSDALVVETTKYPGFESFLAFLHRVLKARLEVGPLDGVERIGLRYIDEVRAPGVVEPSSWKDWIQPSLLGLNHLAREVELTNDAWQGIASYSGPLGVSDLFDQMSLVLRYGVGDGYAIPAGGELRRHTPSPGPFFLIDIDSFWGPATGTVPSLDVDTVATVLEGLHTPVRALFESSITDKLRDEVLRRDGSQ